VAVKVGAAEVVEGMTPDVDTVQNTVQTDTPVPPKP
jgi:hypothetical protein